MSSILSSRLRNRVVFLACAMLFGFAASASADPKPLTKEEQAKVDKAIDRAVAYLKGTQTAEGDGSTTGGRYFPVGECLLAAYALLEAGVPPDDPVIKKAAVYLRAKLPKTNKTYELSLGVLFLDRLGDPKDEKLLRSLALRLIVGQYRSGGWTYLCPQVKDEDEGTLLKLLNEVSKLVEAGKKPSAKWLKDLNVPRAFQALSVLHASGRLPLRDPVIAGKKGGNEEDVWNANTNSGSSDNSNTQFALLALWVAQRHKLPLRPTLDLLVLRFERTQEAHGGWGYVFQIPVPRAYKFHRGEFNSMTCVGLLALAIGRELHGTSRVGSLSGKPSPAWRDPSADGRNLSLRGKSPSEAEDIRILRGLANLYRHVGEPTGQMDRRSPIRQNGFDGLFGFYFLWSLERVAMLYNLPTLGDKEWYRWGAEILVTNQNARGDFPDFYSDRKKTPYGEINTAFALLFLKRSHPMKDLTPKLPFTAEELNKGIARLRTGTVPLEGSTTTPSHNTKPER